MQHQRACCVWALQVIIAVVDLLVWCGAASAVTYYVGKTGVNTNNCSATVPTARDPTTPKLTIAAGLGCLAAGDTLFIKGGTYTESIINPVGGTSDTVRTTIAGLAGDTVILKPASGAYVVALERSSASWVTFDNLHLDGTSIASAVMSISTDTGPGAAQGITLSNSEILNAPTSVDGVFTCETCPGNKFITVHVHNGNNGFYFKGAQNLIEKSQIHDTAAYGIQLYNGGNGSAVNSNTVRQTRIFNAGNFAILMSSGTLNVFSNNLLYNNAAGMQIDYGADTTSLYYNTITNNHGPNGSGVSIGDSNILTIRNTIIYNNDQNGLSGGVSTTQDHNLCSGCALGSPDPKFVLPASGDFRLQAGSPALNQGVAVGTVLTDFAGVTRPQGSAPDIGAYEKFPPGGVPPPVMRPPPRLGSRTFHFQGH